MASTVPVGLADFEKFALDILPKNALDYYQSGANNQETLMDNIVAFSRCDNLDLLGLQRIKKACQDDFAFVYCCGGFFMKIHSKHSIMLEQKKKVKVTSRSKCNPCFTFQIQVSSTVHERCNQQGFVN